MKVDWNQLKSIENQLKSIDINWVHFIEYLTPKKNTLKRVSELFGGVPTTLISINIKRFELDCRLLRNWPWNKPSEKTHWENRETLANLHSFSLKNDLVDVSKMLNEIMCFPPDPDQDSRPFHGPWRGCEGGRAVAYHIRTCLIKAYQISPTPGKTVFIS